MKPQIELALALAKLQGAREVLTLITNGADGTQAGTKAHLLAFILGCSPCATQKDLALRLGLTPGRVCQMLRVLKRSYHVPG